MIEQGARSAISKWLRIGLVSIVGGVSLMALYVAAVSDGPVGPVIGILMGPAYVWRVITGSALYAMMPSLVDTFWIKEFALAGVYMLPLLAVDALIDRFRSTDAMYLQ